MIAALRRHAAPCAVLVLVGAALYGRVLGYDFVQYDDHELLVLHYGDVVKAENIAGVFWRDAFAVLGPEARGVYYRPLLVASYGIEARIAGPNPTLFHATNLALHLLATCLAYALFIAFGCSRWLAAGLALVFSCHPGSALVAAWIPCRNESMLAIACLTSTLALVAFLRGGRTPALALCVAAYAAALFTKESGGVLLGVLACVALLENTGRPGETRSLGWAAVTAIAVALGWAALRHVALGRSPSGAAAALANLPVLPVYLGKMLFPFDLALVPHPDDTSGWPGTAALGALAAAIAFTGRRLLGPPGLGLVWCGAFLLPSLFVSPRTWGLEHRIYLPLIGLLLFAGHLAPPGRRFAARLAFAVAIAFGVVTSRRLSDFADPIVYWESAARAASHSAFAASRVAWRYYEAGRFADVPAAATRALALDDAQPEMYLARGIAYAKQRELGLAEPDLQRAVALDPENADAWSNLAQLQRLLGQHDQGRNSEQQAERLQSRRPVN